MKTIGAMSLDELENIIEQKIMDIFGDPDSGLELREDFKEKLKKRLSGNSKRTVTNETGYGQRK